MWKWKLCLHGIACCLLWMVIAMMSLLDVALAHAQSAAKNPAGQDCVHVSLQGEVVEGKSWSASLGEGWVLQVIPVSSPVLVSVSGNAISDGKVFRGWDLAVNRVGAEAYPDALLLATPPYGSLNAREIATTFGMRVQDAIAWEPRHFRFLTTQEDLTRARELYAQVMPIGQRSDAERNEASAQLLGLLRSARQGSGQLHVEDAHIVPGIADPPLFAQAWTQHLHDVPHSNEQNAVASARGQLRWMRFAIDLWLPGSWKMPSQLRGLRARCAE